ncbi:transglycosylase family protein [Streptomyces sp. NPDC059398]|uniref:transglycosylase family protein n=1 Tax=Streptomyces sp. NPDC059398 TaxID=3346820 RepID=UPI0036995B21
MRTGNGRHRRPRQAPALVVAAGVTGSAIALPLLASTGAHAADATTWDRVALCESGGIWSADLGNGHYGGLQFSQAAWDKYGGGQYAIRPDLASRSQQIAVAEKAYAAEGAKFWASCAAVAGLTKDDADTATVDPGSPATTSPTPSKPAGSDGGSKSTNTDGSGQKSSKGTSSSPSDSSSPTGSPSSDSSPSDSPSGSSSGSSSPSSDASSDTSGTSGASGGSGRPDSSAHADASDSASPSTSDPATPADSANGDAPASPDTSGAGRHRGGESADGPGAHRDESGRHASRGGNPSRNDARTDGSYTVRAGDNLWSIAKAHDLPGGWPALYAANHRTVGADPDFIVPGQSLDLDQNQG